jgi:hypothetical protein
MRAVEPTPQSEVRKLAESSLLHFLERTPRITLAASRRPERPVRLDEPLRVFYLGLRRMVENPGLEDATSVAWRFFVLRGRRVLGATEVALNGRDGSPCWSHVSYDPRIQTHLSVLRRVKQDPRYEGVSYELRFLRIPALDLNALLWLKPVKSGQEFVIPMGSIALLRPGWPYSVDKLFYAVQGLARRRLADSSVPRDV